METLYTLAFIGFVLYFPAVLLNLAVLLRIVLGGGNPIAYFVLLLVIAFATVFWIPLWVYPTILTIGFCVGWWNVKSWALQPTMLSWTLTVLAPVLLSLGGLETLASISILGWLSFPLAVWGVVVRDRTDAAIRRLTRHPSPESAAAVVQLGPSAIGALRHVLRGIEREARLAAVAALGQIGTHEARAELEYALKHRDPEMQSAAAAWLNTPNTIVWHGHRAS